MSTVVMDRAQSPLRWAVLFFGCLTLIGNYYCYDNPAALKTQLQELTGMDEETYNLMYSVYSFPNMLLPFLGGWMCDRFGSECCLLLFAVLLCAGQALFAFGATINSVPVLLLGRVVFGFGGENLTVANSCLLANWFRGKEMAFAMGLGLTISRLGSVINNFVSPRVAASVSVAASTWVGAVICGAGVAFTCILFPINRSVRATIARNVAADEADPGGSTHGSTSGLPTPLPRPRGSINDGMEAPLVINDAAVAAVGAAGPSDAAVQAGAALKQELLEAGGDGVGGGGGGGGGGKSSSNPLATLLRFKPSFWMLTVSCLAVYGCVLPFNNVASSLLMERSYFKPSPRGCRLVDPTRCQSADNPPDAGRGSECPGDDASFAPPLPRNVSIGEIDCSLARWKGAGACTREWCRRQTAAIQTANGMMSIPFIMSAVASPFLGYAIDRFGGRALLALLCPAVLIAVHLLLGYALSIGPALPLVGQGLAYSVFAAALWPSVPFTVPGGAEGLAYGLITAVQNGGLGGFPLLVSIAYDAAGQSYIPAAELLFTGFAVVGLVAGVGLNCYDVRHGHALNRVHLHGAAAADADADAEGTVAPLSAVAVAPDPAD